MSSLGCLSAGSSRPLPLWQQRRAALGSTTQQQQQQPDAPPPLTLQELIQQVLSWHLPSVLSSRPGAVLAAAGGARGAAGLSAGVPIRFASLAEYTGTFRALLMEELRAHLQQSHEENPLPLGLPGVLGSGSGGAADAARAGGSSGSEGRGGGSAGQLGGVRLQLLEVQRRSHFYHLEFEVSGESSRERDSGIVRSLGRESEWLLYIVGWV